MKKKFIMEIYRWVVRNFPVIRKWTRWIRPLACPGEIRVPLFLERVFPLKCLLPFIFKVRFGEAKKSNFNFQMRRKGLPVFSMLVSSALKPCYVILVFVTLILTMVEMVKGHEDHLRPYNKDIWKLRHSQHQHER